MKRTISLFCTLILCLAMLGTVALPAGAEAYTGDKVFYDPDVATLSEGDTVTRTVDGMEVTLTVGTNVVASFPNDAFKTVDGVVQVYFLAKEYAAIDYGTNHGTKYVFYGAKAGINPNDPDDITKPGAARSSDEGETVISSGNFHVNTSGKVILDGFTFKNSAKIQVGDYTGSTANTYKRYMDVINCRTSTATDAYTEEGPVTAFVHCATAEKKTVNLRYNRFAGIDYSNEKSVTAMLVIRNWTGVVEHNYFSAKDSKVIGATTATPNVFWFQGETLDSYSYSGSMDVSVQNNYVEGTVYRIEPRWYEDYKVHILNNTIIPVATGRQIYILASNQSKYNGTNYKYTSNIDTADIKIVGNTLLNQNNVEDVIFTELYCSSPDSAIQADLAAYTAGNIKITGNKIDLGQTAGKGFNCTATTLTNLSNYPNMVVDITCNQYSQNVTVSASDVLYKELNVTLESAHVGEMEQVTDLAPTAGETGLAHTECAFCGKTVTTDIVLSATGAFLLDGKTYGSYSETLAKAENGDTITLRADTAMDTLIVPTGITLDLAGFAITAQYVVGYNGSALINSADNESGKLIVAKDSVALAKNNSYLPVYDDEKGCYLLTRVQNEHNALETGAVGTLPKYITAPLFKDYVHPLLDSESKIAASGVEILIRLRWTDAEEQYDGMQDFIYRAPQIASVIGSYVNEDGTVDYKTKFYGIFTGYEITSGTNIYVSTVVRSAAGVESESQRTLIFAAI